MYSGVPLGITDSTSFEYLKDTTKGLFLLRVSFLKLGTGHPVGNSVYSDNEPDFSYSTSME